MEIICPSCSKRYRVEDSLIPEGGRNVKCRKCGHMFRIERPKREEEETAPVPFELDLGGTEAAPSGQEGQPEPSQVPHTSEGTVRISRDQIEASVRASGAVSVEPEETGDAPGIQLDQERVAEVQSKSVEINPAELPDQPVKRLNNFYRVRIDGKEHKGLTLEDLKKWINEDRLLENDEVCRHGSILWVKAETVPELKKFFSLHVYQQRKEFDKADNPYVRFKEKEEKQASGDGFFSKIKSLFGGR